MLGDMFACWTTSGVILGRRGSKWQLGFPTWAHIGALLGPSGGPLGVSWGLLGPSWGLLGASWGLLGGLLEASWSLLGASRGHLGGDRPKKGGGAAIRAGAPNVASWAPLEAILERSWALLGPFWGSLGPLLGPSCGSLMVLFSWGNLGGYRSKKGGGS